jgi:hypothetical protein
LLLMLYVLLSLPLLRSLISAICPLPSALRSLIFSLCSLFSAACSLPLLSALFSLHPCIPLFVSGRPVRIPQSRKEIIEAELKLLEWHKMANAAAIKV